MDAWSDAPPNYFSTLTLDRLSDRRRDEAWIAKRLAGGLDDLCK